MNIFFHINMIIKICFLDKSKIAITIINVLMLITKKYEEKFLVVPKNAFSF